jgi:hypothetical protein
MIQHVDFYQRIKEEPLVPKSVIQLCIAWLCVPAFYALWAGYLLMSQGDSLQLLSDSKNENAQLLKQIEALSNGKQLNNFKVLSQELVVRKRLYAEKQTLLTRLRDPVSSNLIGFSEIFRGLSRQHVPGVSLNRIEVTQSGSIFSMSGTLANPIDLPTYIVRLGEEDAFSRMTFEKLLIQEKNTDTETTADEDLRFEIHSISPDSVTGT